MNGETVLSDARVVESSTSSALKNVSDLLWTALLVAVGYSFFSTGSKGICTGATEANDATAEGTLAATSSCLQLNLRPSAFVLLSLAAIVFITLRKARLAAADASATTARFTRAANVILIIGIASVVIGQAWFWMIPIDDWDGTGTFFFPVPFVQVEMIVS